MPLATLKFPRSLTTQGKMFKKGVSEPVSDEVAEILACDKRFEVKGLPSDQRADRARLAATSGGRPYVRSVRLEMIRNANSTLDPDITENYDADGKPSIVGLAKAMGWTPDAGEINEALRIRRRPGTLGSDGDSVDAQAEPVLAVNETGAHFLKDAEIEPASIADRPGMRPEEFAALVKKPIGKVFVKKPRQEPDTTAGGVEIS